MFSYYQVVGCCKVHLRPITFFSKNKEQENIENASEDYIRVKHSIFVESDSSDLKEDVKKKKKEDKTEHDSGEGC